MPSNPMNDAEMMLHYAEIEDARWGDYFQRFKPTLLKDKPYLWQYIDDTFSKIFAMVGKRKTILDVGCGTAFYHPLLEKYADNIIGIDFSYAMISRAVKISSIYNTKGGTYILGDVRRLPLKDNSIDCIFSWDVLHHVTGKSGIVDVVSEIHRVLEDGGYYIGLEPNILNPLMMLYCLIRPEEHGALFIHSFYMKSIFSKRFSEVMLVPNNCIISYVNENNISLVRAIERMFSNKPLSIVSFRDVLIAKK